jgi:predicted nucleic acid-binding protein
LRAVYLETSALGRALLHGDQEAYAVLQRVGGHKLFTSALTFAELDRAILRQRREGKLDVARERAARRVLHAAEQRLHVMDVTADILARASRAFEVEPVRTLDAIHLATALAWDEGARGELAVFTRDPRVRDNAAAYGFDLL